MKISKRFFFPACALSIFLASQSLGADPETGRKLMLSKKKGNCVACHKFQGSVQPGNMGPELVSLKLKFPNREDLKARVWDATRFNPISAMPPFGRNGILTDPEIERIVDFLETL